MKTNKRTVWFLTLLSLVAVISIYSFNKKPMPFDGLKIFEDGAKKTTVDGKVVDTDGKAPVFAESYFFDEMRMEVRNERSQAQDQLNTKLDAAETSDEKNAVFDEKADITKRDSAEALMEMQIIALGYADAFVRTDGKAVKVTVLSEDGHSKKQGAEITNLVMTTWEDARDVVVDFQAGS